VLYAPDEYRLTVWAGVLGEAVSWKREPAIFRPASGDYFWRSS
jgi:hypothetical protein